MSAPSSLVSWGTTDPLRLAPDAFAREVTGASGVERGRTIASLATATRQFRELQARKHDTVRRQAQTNLDTTLAYINAREREKASWGETSDSPDPVLEDLRKLARELERRRDWHTARARGHRDRFERVTACGGGKARAKCQECGSEHELPVRCDVWRVCVACRANAAIERRARFGRGRAASIRRATKAGALSRYRRGGRWSEKHMTLTIPHLTFAGEDDVTVRRRVELIFDAWRIFSIALRKRWLAQRIAPLMRMGLSRGEARARARVEQRICPERFYRFFEWTPGHDLKGHPHFHVWLMCPWLDQRWAATTWANSLRRAGCFIDVDPIVDIREIRTRPHTMSRELLKTKDAIKLSRLEVSGRGGQDVIEYADGWSIVDAVDGERIPIAVVAALYEALEARRVSQASLGLLPEHELAICVECGTQGAMQFRVLPVEIPEGPGVKGARAPPSVVT